MKAGSLCPEHFPYIAYANMTNRNFCFDKSWNVLDYIYLCALKMEREAQTGSPMRLL